jgi:predicted GNAT family N-acyltransferase
MPDLQGYFLINDLNEQHKEQLLELYRNEWWSKNRTSADIDTILSGSSLIIGIVEKTTNNLIGFTRILSDFFKYAYIYDVIVDPKYRKNGLGKIIMEAILAHPKLQNIKCLELTCIAEMVPFYSKYGFSKDYGSTISMRRLNPALKND